jgi:hypothetical protein
VKDGGTLGIESGVLEKRFQVESAKDWKMGKKIGKYGRKEKAKDMPEGR